MFTGCPAKAVPLPLMPVGVEHSKAAFLAELSRLVPLPLMPVGVEHEIFFSANAVPTGAFTFDACRR